MFNCRLSHRVGRSSQAMTAAVEESHHSLTHRIQDTPGDYAFQDARTRCPRISGLTHCPFSTPILAALPRQSKAQSVTMPWSGRHSCSSFLDESILLFGLTET